MKVLYFDCFSGISGDMTVAALLDLGIDAEIFKKELGKLKIGGYKLEISKKVKNGIVGTDFKVILDHDVTHDHEHTHVHHGDPGHDKTHDHHADNGYEQVHGNSHNHYHDYEHTQSHHHHTCGHENNHAYDHMHNHAHNHSHEHGHNHGHDHAHSARNLNDIKELIRASHLKQRVKDFSIRVFEEIARAEAAVHNKGIEEVHFHEVGAVDSIVDIVGTAICLDLLGVDRVYSSPVHEGTGFIECQHGKLPVPVPAVMEMLKGSDIPLITEDVNTELVTPTGMGIIKCLASGFGKMPVMTVEKVGYGMGKRETGRFNALRVVLGTLREDIRKPGDIGKVKYVGEVEDIAETEDGTETKDIREVEGIGETENVKEAENTGAPQEIVVLETNIDDMNPEILGYTAETLLENGALDVFFTPVYMKKNRPAVMLTVLSDKMNEEKLVDIVLRETSTIGIRRYVCSRYTMSRCTVKVSTEYGDIRVKAAQKGDIRKFAPEYEDCREIARKTGLPIRKIYEKACEKAGKLI